MDLKTVCSLGSTSEFVISSSYLGLPARVVGPGSLHLCPTYLYINVVFSFIFFRKICPVVSFRSFSERVVLYLPLILLYLWEEVSSKSSFRGGSGNTNSG